MYKTNSSDQLDNQINKWLEGELRSDHAGEIGAIWIYRGILATSRNSEVRDFARQHLETEKQHLKLIDGFLDRDHRSWLLPLWRVAGFLTGALPSIFSSQAVFATVSTVETFVVSHYMAQIDRLQSHNSHNNICRTLQSCCDDEARHESEASDLLNGKPSFFLRVWCALVSSGSNLAVKCARIIWENLGTLNID